MLAKLKGWKTVIFNAAVGLASLGLAFMPYLLGVDWAKLGADGTKAAVLVFVVNMVNIALRFVTTSAIGAKE